VTLLISTLFDGRPLGVFGLLGGIALGTLVWYRTLRITDELRIVRAAEVASWMTWLRFPTSPLRGSKRSSHSSLQHRTNDPREPKATEDRAADLDRDRRSPSQDHFRASQGTLTSSFGL
jgi:hypothetical protein